MRIEILNNEGRVVNTILATEGEAERPYPGVWRIAETQEVEETLLHKPWEWLMDTGPFADRLGAASVAIDVSIDPKLVATRSDFDRRKWIDLKDPRVIAAVQYLAGQPHAVLGTKVQPLLTAEQADAVLTTPVAPAENLALRKLYFS